MTVTDPNGLPYSFAVVSAVLSPSTPGGYQLGGFPYSGQLPATALDKNGSVTVNMGSNAAITPGGSQWLFSVTIAGIQPPAGTGPQSFSVTLTISGASQNITSSLNAAAPALSNRGLLQPPVGISATAAKYGLHRDGQIAWAAGCTNGNTTVSTGVNDPPFVAADVGKVIFGTNQPQLGGNPPNATLIVGSVSSDVTITSFIDAHHATVSVAPSAGCVGLTNLVWGTPDALANGTGPLLSIWADAVNACTAAVFPGINSEGTQAAYILVESDWTAVQPTNVNCLNATGAARSGPGVFGAIGQGQTVFISTPTFNTATCTGAATNSCYFFDSNGGTAGGLTLSNFSIWGDGLALSGAGTNPVLSIGAQGIMNRVYCLEWQPAASSTGINLIGQDIFVHGIQSDGCTATGVVAKQGGSTTRYIFIDDASYMGDNTTTGLLVQNGVVVSTGNLYGPDGTGTTGNIQVASGAELISTNDQCIEAGNACYEMRGGTLHLTGLTIPTFTGSGAGIFPTTGTSTVYASNNDLTGGGESIFVSAATTLNWFDLGGNVYNATPVVNSGTFNPFGSASITGTACTTGNWALTSGWGASTISSVTAGGDSHRCQVIITGAPGAASPVLTWTFPKAYALGSPASCQISFNGTLTGESTGAPSTTSVAFTFTGTPSAQTYRLDGSCGP